MAITKKDEFTSEEIWLSDIAKALSHPARIKILKILNETDSCIVGTIVDKLPLAQATVSQHLKELKRVGLIEGEIDGPKVCYCLNNKTLVKAKSALDKLFSKIGCC
ncbi:Putative ArsR-like transcriptional regulator [Ignavibacterium album JCM 16511]|uniref:Putative ArsR-like transcriptional regulator n=1 Tax=Ignavibacterium album (strain DSM 19864 / JCM 16511 / NBRC 101810 / Mat9-16) TaxID=945713 RepID=I0AN35_IGNAJ|nr:metalloregulator ArsR/SmtB family transcription factor [Ignavibacterium album]AFH50392.1 Putative ArsR-like transcriptional regulator [Ignavibacterium album JCM 16511]